MTVKMDTIERIPEYDALTENLFHDSSDDLRFLESDEGKCAIVALHVDGITNYLKSK